MILINDPCDPFSPGLIWAMVIVYIVYHLSCDTNFASIPAPSNCAINWIARKVVICDTLQAKPFHFAVEIKNRKLPNVFFFFNKINYRETGIEPTPSSPHPLR
jgi:hypothetical protein